MVVWNEEEVGTQALWRVPYGHTQSDAQTSLYLGVGVQEQLLVHASSCSCSARHFQGEFCNNPSLHNCSELRNQLECFWSLSGLVPLHSPGLAFSSVTLGSHPHCASNRVHACSWRICMRTQFVSNKANLAFPRLFANYSPPHHDRTE